ncbi:MAG: CaiB/BaiF CoA transferase family protein [Dehalococcoidia bacterium]
MAEEEAAGPLDGLRVLELASVEGQYCGKLLGDMGANVIKVEPPEGDRARRIGPFAGEVGGIDGNRGDKASPFGPNRSLSFWYYNTNKRGVTLDIGCREGQTIVRRLVASADVLVESFPPGYLQSQRLAYQTLAEINPGLVFASITAFGQTGPWRDLHSSDLVNMALGGPMASNGYDDIPGAPPIRPDGDHSFLIAGEYACTGILTALLERDRLGAGQRLDISIHEACASTVEGAFPNWEYFRRIVKRQTGRHANPQSTRPWQYQTADDRYVNLMGGGIPRSFPSWRPLLQWMARHGAAADLQEERYEAVLSRSPAQRRDEDGLHVLDTIGRFVQGLSAEEVYREGQARKLPWATIRSPEENLNDPHWQDRGFFVEVEQPELGQPIRYPGAPYRFSRTPWRLRNRAPLLGEHNVQIYEGELGFSRQELRALYEQRII